MENLVVATLNVYCPKFVIARNEELQRVFDSTKYCVTVCTMRQYSTWNKSLDKSYVLRFELEDHRYMHPIQEESEEQRNYNEDNTTYGVTAIPK